MHAGTGTGWGRRVLALAVLAAAVCAGAPAHGQVSEAPARTLELSARPRTGQVIRLELRKEQERQAPNQPLRRTSSLTHVTVEVLESNVEGFAVRWSHARPPAAASGDAAQLTADAEAVRELVRDIRYEMEFDTAGEFVQLRNYDEVRALVDRMLDELETLLARRGNAAAAEQASAMVKRMFASRANLEAVLLREPRMFFFPLGKSFPLEATREYDAQLPNPFGGPALPAHGVVRVDWVDLNNGLASITVDQNLHPDSARIVIESLIERLPPGNRPKDVDLSQVKVEIRDLGRYSVNLADSLPERMDFTRSTRVPGGYRADVVSIRRVE